MFIQSKAKKQKEVLQDKVNALEERLSVATAYIEKIAAGELNTAFQSGPSGNDAAAQPFYETLQRLHNTLSDYSKKEDERKWIAEGMAMFMRLLGGNNQAKEDFYDDLLKLLVQYTGANQAGVFLLNDQHPEDLFLELTACYAFSKKKFLEKRIEIGQGLLGQCYLEKETHFFSEIPPYFTTITSGLGEATPSFLLLIPMKYNEEVLGVIELAYFTRPEAYKIEFTEKIAENIAAVTLNIRHATRAEVLFKESQQKAKALQEQEEALRQNVEELIATQEGMKRNQEELDRQTHLLKFILDNIPFPIFVKDEKGRYTLVNIAESKLFNLHDKDLLGKDDSHFVRSHEEYEVIRKSDEAVLASDEPVELPLQHFTTSSGNAYIFKTSKIPFVNPVTGEKNILGVSIDLTEKLTLEKNLLTEKRINSNNIVLNIAGRQRMLSQKIGFYCETLVRGKKQYSLLLRDAIELHEHTMQVIRYGGMPMGIACETPLRPLDEALVPCMEAIEKIWQVYKQAAEGILYFSSPDRQASSAQPETLASLTIIEDNAELLLSLNNDFMTAYIAHSHARFAEAF